MDVQAPVLKDKGWTGGLGPSVEGQGMDWGVRPQCLRTRDGCPGPSVEGLGTDWGGGGGRPQC